MVRTVTRSASSPLVRPFGTGTHTFAVRAVDTAGNVGTSISRTWKVAMPPAGVKPTDEEIQTIRAWIEAGATAE